MPILYYVIYFTEYKWNIYEPTLHLQSGIVEFQSDQKK